MSTLTVVNLDAVPQSLKALPQWVCWRQETRDEKPTKVPYCARTGRRARSNDPKTWASYAEVVGALSNGRGYSGVGIMFPKEGPLAGIDLDDCIDEAGELLPYAREIVERFKTYCEISPSGHGVKLIFNARKPTGAVAVWTVPSGESIEVYDSGRYFTLTGRVLAGASPEVEDRQAELDTMWAECRKKASTQEDARSDEGEPDSYEVAERSAIQSEGAQAQPPQGGALEVGKRHPKLISLAGKLRRAGLNEAAIRAALREYNQDRAVVKVPLPDAELEEIIKFVGKKPKPEQIVLGERTTKGNLLVLSTRQTLPTAVAFLREHYAHPEGRTLIHYAGLPMAWRDGRHAEVEEGTLCKTLQSWLAESFVKGERGLEPFPCNPRTIRAALDSILYRAHLPVTIVPPAWLGKGAESDRPPANELLPCRSGLLHIPTGRTLAHTPRFFTTSALDFDFDPNAPQPARWLSFLREVFGDDAESIQLLQEWAGYCLIPETRQQKMLMLVGPRRGGKGTMARILSRLVGPDNVAAPTTSSLATPFGLQPLIGKSLAVVSDARFHGEHIPTIVERLLCISGEDAITIDRKYLGSVTLKLPTRFMFLSNELPRFNETSGALAGRFLILRLTQSFYGREDPDLTARLVAELPGILLWALEGWRRLQERGRFAQPESAAEAVRELEDLSSPVGAFLRDKCEICPGYRVLVDDIYAAWRVWCDLDGRTAVTSKQVFGRDLAAAAPCVVCRRNRATSTRFYEGIRLRNAVDDQG